MSYCFQESEETTLLRESIRNFAREKIKPLAQKLDKEEEFSRVMRGYPPPPPPPPRTAIQKVNVFGDEVKAVARILRNR